MEGNNIVYQLIVECNNYCGTPSKRRCNAMKEYLEQRISSIDSVEMIENEVIQNLIRPQIFIRYDNNHSGKLLESLDEKLLEIGLYAIKALVVKVATHAVEGIIIGGGLGALVGSRKNEKLLASLVGALIGGAVGDLIEKGTLELVANKGPSGWMVQTFTK